MREEKSGALGVGNDVMHEKSKTIGPEKKLRPWWRVNAIVGAVLGPGSAHGHRVSIPLAAQILRGGAHHGVIENLRRLGHDNGRRIASDADSPRSQRAIAAWGRPKEHMRVADESRGVAQAVNRARLVHLGSLEVAILRKGVARRVLVALELRGDGKVADDDVWKGEAARGAPKTRCGVSESDFRRVFARLPRRRKDKVRSVQAIVERRRRRKRKRSRGEE